MAGIFINYRRDDAPGVAGRLFDHLSPKFSRAGIFMDVDPMKPGMDFVKQLDAQVAQCHIVLAVIGPHWLDARDQNGQRRLDSDHDYVRIELASALKRDIPVIPVLVDGAVMPAEESLPDDLKSLARRHALELRHTRFNADANAIMHALEDLAPTRRLPRWPIFAGAAAAAAVVVVAVFWPQLSAKLRSAKPSPVVTVPKSSVVQTQKPAVIVKPSASNAPSGGQQPATSSSASRDQNPVDGGMAVTIGDTYEAISAAYKTHQQLEPQPGDKKYDWLYLEAEGIEFFFDGTHRISSIHFVAPWGGSIHGVKLGDTADQVKKLLGPPKASQQRFGGYTTALIYHGLIR